MSIRIAWPRRGLYLLTPDESDTGRLLARTRPLLGAGIAMLQYRNKIADAALRMDQAQALAKACHESRTPFIVNDDWKLALAVDADGAHLGEDDGELREARAALGPRRLLGASCYGRLDLAERATTAGADYLAFGAFFPSGTKPGARRADPGLLREAAKFGLPQVAIGGITPDNADSLIHAGADLVAVIGAVFDAADPVAIVRAFNQRFES